MPSQTYILEDEYRRRLALRAVQLAPAGMAVVIDEPQRDNDQNAHLHALLADIADQLAWPKDTGEFHPLAWWKPRATFAWLKDRKRETEIITPLEKDANEKEFAILLPHTSHLKKKDFADLIEWTASFGAFNGVIFKEPKPKDGEADDYEGYR